MVTPSPIAQDESTEWLPLRRAYSFLEANGLASEASEIKTSRERLGSFTVTLKGAKIVDLLSKKNLLDKFIETSWRFASTPAGKKRVKRYERVYLRYSKIGGTNETDNEDMETEKDEAETKFALEEQLRDYLARNLSILEPGLSLWPMEDGDAVEFQVDEQGVSRRIDILAKDQSGLPVVIELKVSRGHERTIGQALYYRARIKHRFDAKKVRIFIVAAEISRELRDAASEVSDVHLFEYTLAVKVVTVPALTNG